MIAHGQTSTSEHNWTCIFIVCICCKVYPRMQSYLISLYDYVIKYSLSVFLSVYSIRLCWVCIAKIFEYDLGGVNKANIWFAAEEPRRLWTSGIHILAWVYAFWCARMFVCVSFSLCLSVLVSISLRVCVFHSVCLDVPVCFYLCVSVQIVCACTHSRYSVDMNTSTTEAQRTKFLFWWFYL